MSKALYTYAGLRSWSEDEIELREAFQARAVAVVRRTLTGINPAWQFMRTEGPCLAPESAINPAYTPDDVFVTNHARGGERFLPQPRNNRQRYRAAHASGRKLPLCVWQARKSFRRETNDGATAEKLRFNEFWQLEFQCIYRADTKADYRTPLINAVGLEVSRFTRLDTRVINSDRLPSYSESTLDIEVMHGGSWREVASCSIRTDYAPDVRVCEIAVGLCRVAAIAGRA
ncbi:MAG: hypothetical protein HC889_16940 [Synechococcaceae cyanobacterium SM1_2_3]|nr:hypothetical protein [Synechococcaceae cyanobacterium SM1_2_3]